jgi:hypothetical protein
LNAKQSPIAHTFRGGCGSGRALLLSLAACRDGEPATARRCRRLRLSAPTAAASPDLYDLLEMDFKAPAAVLTNERHTGAFAAGDALNMGAASSRLWQGR